MHALHKHFKAFKLWAEHACRAHLPIHSLTVASHDCHCNYNCGAGLRLHDDNDDDDDEGNNGNNGDGDYLQGKRTDSLGARMLVQQRNYPSKVMSAETG